MSPEFGFTPGKHVLASRAHWSSQIELAIINVDGYGNFHQGRLQMEPTEEGAPIIPCVTLRMQQAQELMDALWQAGLRPTEGTGSAGSLKATERHLEDMRRVVFDERVK